MNLLKNILSVVGLVLIVVIIGAYAKYDIGGKMDKVKALDAQAMPAYMEMLIKF